MSKKILLLLLCAVFALSALSCAKEPSAGEEGAPASPSAQAENAGENASAAP